MTGAGGPATDDFAAGYMAGSGRVLFRDKVVGRLSLALLGLVTLWCGGGAVATFLGLFPGSSAGVGAFLLLLAAFFAFLGATLTVVRSVVSEGELLVQYGLWGPRIPIRSIERCRVVPYDWKRFGGWGIKRSSDGTWAYVMSARGDVVEVTWTDDAGRQKCALFSATDPKGVADSVRDARVRVRAGSRIAQARVVAALDGGDLEGQAEREAEAAGEAVPGRSRDRAGDG